LSPSKIQACFTELEPSSTIVGKRVPTLGLYLLGLSVFRCEMGYINVAWFFSVGFTGLPGTGNLPTYLYEKRCIRDGRGPVQGYSRGWKDP
jgi:hypothetical protein